MKENFENPSRRWLVIATFKIITETQLAFSSAELFCLSSTFTYFSIRGGSHACGEKPAKNSKRRQGGFQDLFTYELVSLKGHVDFDVLMLSSYLNIRIVIGRNVKP